MTDTTPAEAKVAVMGRNHRCNNSERLLADNHQEEEEEEVQELLSFDWLNDFFSQESEGGGRLLLNFSCDECRR